MQTVSETMKALADAIISQLEVLLLEHSAIYKWNTGDGRIRFITASDYAYRELTPEAKQIQARLLEGYRRYSSILQVLLREQPREALKTMKNSDETLVKTIEQDHTSSQTTQEALSRAREAIGIQHSLLNNLYSPAAGDVCYVPDTNALLHNPALENWVFDETPTFTLVFTPTVLSELDELKVSHRNEIVREKAERVIRQIKEYRRRGRLSDGVPLVTGRSSIVSIAFEPNMQATLPWLDATNQDDRFLATIIEVMRLRPRSIVLAVSRDINFQNKAEFAQIPFVEPPDPIKAE